MSLLLQDYEQSQSMIARAIVRSNNDPDKLGRIQVEYPWFHGNDAQIPSEWARICFPYASKDSGTWFIPEIGDEVLVLFENGDLDHPVIIGTMYNPKNTPPSSGKSGDFNSDNQNHLKFIKTKAGHMLCFDDKDGEGGITLQAFNCKVTLEDKKISIQRGSEQIQLEEGKVEAKAGSEKVTLKNGEITIHSSGKINLGEGAAHPLIFGDLFMQVFNAHSHPTGVGPSGTPSTPMTPDMLSQKVKTY